MKKTRKKTKTFKKLLLMCSLFMSIGVFSQNYYPALSLISINGVTITSINNNGPYHTCPGDTLQLMLDYFGNGDSTNGGSSVRSVTNIFVDALVHKYGNIAINTQDALNGPYVHGPLVNGQPCNCLLIYYIVPTNIPGNPNPVYLGVDGYTYNGITYQPTYTALTLCYFNAIETYNASLEIKSIQYYNLLGQKIDSPIQGISIIFTEYTNGTYKTDKIIH